MESGPIPDNPAATRQPGTPGATAGAIPDSPAATRQPGTPGATAGAVPDSPAATRQRGTPGATANPIPGEEADVPGARNGRRAGGAQPAAVVAPVVPPDRGADGTDRAPEDPPSATGARRGAPTEGDEGPERVRLPGRIPPVNVPDTRSRFRDVPARRSLLAAREALRDALEAEDSARIAESRRALEQARAALAEATDEESQAWLAALDERRALLRQLRSSPDEWEAHVAMERRARWARLLAAGAEEAGALGPEVRAELRTHGNRMARLARVREVAEESGDQPTIERVDAVVDREVARHAAALRRLGLDGDLEEGL